MAVGRIGADDEDHIGLHDAVEILRARGGAERRLQAIAGRGMADTGAGIDIIVAAALTDPLLDETRFTIVSAAGGIAADAAVAIFGRDAPDHDGVLADSRGRNWD